MKIDLSRHAPPGFRVQDEVKGFWGGCFGATAFSLITFISRFNDELDQLYHRNGSNRTLIPGAIMPDFVEIFDRSYWACADRSALCLSLSGEQKYLHHAPAPQSLGTASQVPDLTHNGDYCISNFGICDSAYFLYGLYEDNPRCLPDSRSVAEDMECVICLKLRM